MFGHACDGPPRGQLCSPPSVSGEVRTVHVTLSRVSGGGLGGRGCSAQSAKAFLVSVFVFEQVFCL